MDLENRTLKLQIRKPMHYAGRTLRWADKYGEVGMGVNEEALCFAKRNGLWILIESDGEEKGASADVWMSFGVDHNSILRVRSQTIYVFPWSECRKPKDSLLAYF